MLKKAIEQADGAGEAEMLTQQLQLLRLNRKCATCNACPGRDSCVGIKLKACSRCHTAWFCSQECQRLGWPTHKPECARAVAKKVSA